MNNDVKKFFLKKLYEELQLFRSSILQMDKEKIYEEAYKIEIYASLYKILVEQSEDYPVQLLEKMIVKGNVLQLLYDTWLKKEDGLYEELCSHVIYEIEKAVERSQDGKQYDTFAEGE